MALIDISHSYFVDTVSGSDTNCGMSADSALATVAEAYGRLGSIGGTIYIYAPENDPIRETFELNVGRRIVLDATRKSQPWYWYGTTQHTSGWTLESGTVYSKSVASDPVAPIFITTIADGDFYAVLTAVGDDTAPANGEYGYSGGKVYVSLPSGQNPNSHTLEISTVLAPIRVSNNRSAPLIIKNGVVRGGRTGCVVGSSTDRGGLVVMEDVTCQYGNNNIAIQPASGFSSMLCRRVVSQKAGNDGFNLHNDALRPCLMRLEYCTGSYNGDEGASPHDSTVMEIIGGEFSNNGSGGVAAIQNAVMKLYEVTFDSNAQNGASQVEGGVYYADEASGAVIGCTVTNNDGPGLHVNKSDLVTVFDLTSSGNTYSDTY